MVFKKENKTRKRIEGKKIKCPYVEGEYIY